MDRKAIRTDDQRLERIQLIEYNRQKRAEKRQNDEILNKQIMVLIIFFCVSLIFVFYLI
jgi:hypothetical protein